MMMNKLLFGFLCLIMPINMCAQEENSSKINQMYNTGKKTKYEKFVEEAGSFLKFQEYKIPMGIVTGNRGFGDINTKVRHIIGKGKYYFFVTVSEDNNPFDYYIAIDYDDFIEINKAIKRLLSEVESDCKLTSEYIENSYTTDDGFCVGYYVENAKAKWFVNVDWRINKTMTINKTVIIRKVEDMIENFQRGQAKLEELLLKYNK